MRVALIVLALLGAAMAATKNPSRIVGGSATSVEVYPYMANMEYHLWNFFWLQWCGGSLLTSTSILSAAHCFDGDSASQWRTRLGSSTLNGGQLHSASQLILHANYNGNTIDNDIAIVKLATAATYSNVVGPARIPGQNYIVQDGSIVTAIGWGSLSSGGPSPDVLHHVDINIINQELCYERYEHLKTLPGFQNFPSITPRMICAGILDVGGKDACQGDSGGPLAHDGDIIVGVTSWGYGCAEPLYPGVSARVSYFSDWVVENGSG